MQKRGFIPIALFTLLIITSLVNAAGSGTNDVVRGRDNMARPLASQSVCQNSGGTWKEFPNTCADSCELARNPETIQCGLALTDGCECGEDKCWNGQTCEQNQRSNISTQIMSCAEKTDRTQRIRCRLENRIDTENREPEWSSEESCRNLADTSSNSKITKGLCRALYSTSKQCYEMQESENTTKEEVEKCFQRAAGLQRRVSEDLENKEAVRKYLVLRLYNLQEKIENAQENDRINSEKAAEAIELIVQIKEKIMNGENKETIRPLIQELKAKIGEMKNE